MAIDRKDRSLTRVPSLRNIKPLPEQTHELIVHAPPPPADPDALAADQRFAALTAAQLLAELQVQRARATKAFYAMGLTLCGG